MIGFVESRRLIGAAFAGSRLRSNDASLRGAYELVSIRIGSAHGVILEFSMSLQKTRRLDRKIISCATLFSSIQTCSSDRMGGSVVNRNMRESDVRRHKNFGCEEHAL